MAVVIVNRKRARKKVTLSCKASRKNRRLEQALVKACLEYLSYVNCVAFRNNSGVVFVDNGDGSKRAVRMGIPGVSDIIGFTPDGRFLAIECKTEKGKLSKSQVEFLRKVELAGGVALVVRDVNGLVDRLQIITQGDKKQ